MKTENRPIARSENIVVQKSGDEMLIYDLTENRAFCLNETSAMVWELCDGSRTVSEISSEMNKKLKASVNEELVLLALDQIGKDGLLDNREEDYFNGLSRREMIRKVGFATVVALPVVSSLVAPTASSAASCLGLGTTCTTLTACCSNICSILTSGIGGAGTGVGNQNCCAGSGTRAPGAYFCNSISLDPSFATGRCCSGSFGPNSGPPCPAPLIFKSTCA